MSDFFVGSLLLRGNCVRRRIGRMDEVLSILHALQRLVSYKRESEELKKKPKQRIAAQMVTYFEEGAGKLCGFFLSCVAYAFFIA